MGWNLSMSLRSVAEASMVLFFMFAASWRLTVVTFVIIPVILTITELYGSYVRYFPLLTDLRDHSFELLVSQVGRHFLPSCTELLQPAFTLLCPEHYPLM